MRSRVKIFELIPEPRYVWQWIEKTRDFNVEEYSYKLEIPFIDIKGSSVEDVFDWLILNHYLNFIWMIKTREESNTFRRILILRFDSNDLKTEFLLRL